MKKKETRKHPANDLLEEALKWEPGSINWVHYVSLALESAPSMERGRPKGGWIKGPDLIALGEMGVLREKTGQTKPYALARQILDILAARDPALYQNILRNSSHDSVVARLVRLWRD